MNILLISQKRKIFFPKVKEVNNIISISKYVSHIHRNYLTDVIIVDESVDEINIQRIRSDFEEAIIIGIGPNKKYILDFGLNAYLQTPYTTEQLFQTITLGGLTHYLLVTFPLDKDKDKVEKKHIFCL